MRRWGAFWALAALIAVASCSSSGGGAIAPRSTIHLARNPWGAAELDCAVARILLTEQLGLDVEVVDVDEYAQWEQVARGELDASLEVWPSGHASDIAQYVRTGRVEDGGPLGPVGKIGWYVPTYLLERHPELATWDGYKAAASASIFRTPRTGGKGQFLGGDPSWTQYDQQIIANLGLDLEEVMSGSEAATLAELDDAYAHGEPLLFYLWLPHYAFVKYDLTNVALPPYSDACWSKAATGGVDCDYPVDHLFKILWPGLRSANPRAHALLEHLTLSTRDQLDMLGWVGIDGQSVDDAARRWIAANPAKWRAWLDPIPASAQ